jgi:hypothetical protein
MTKKTKETRVPLSDVSRQLENSFVGADRARATHLLGLQRARGAKAAGLEREHRRLSRSLGARHPRVVALSEKLAVNATLSRQLVYESERAKAETPTPEARGYIVHGHVRDQDLTAVPGLTVALYDQEGNWVRRLGFDCTDQTGHFKLCYGAGAKDEPDRPEDPNQPDQLEPKPGEDRDVRTIGARAGKRDYVLHVLDKKSTLLHRHPRTVRPALGRVDYREIILGEEADCPPPEPTPGSDPLPRPEPDRPEPDRPEPDRPEPDRPDPRRRPRVDPRRRPVPEEGGGLRPVPVTPGRVRATRDGGSLTAEGGEAEDTGVKPKRRKPPRTAAGSKKPAAAKKPSGSRKKRK